MSYDIAFVREQGMNLVVVCVDDNVLDSSSRSAEIHRSMQLRYRLPTAIVGARRRQIYGDRRIVPWLSSIDLDRLPWRQAS